MIKKTETCGAESINAETEVLEWNVWHKDIWNVKMTRRRAPGARQPSSPFVLQLIPEGCLVSSEQNAAQTHCQHFRSFSCRWWLNILFRFHGIKTSLSAPAQEHHQIPAMTKMHRADTHVHLVKGAEIKSFEALCETITEGWRHYVRMTVKPCVCSWLSDFLSMPLTVKRR